MVTLTAWCVVMALGTGSRGAGAPEHEPDRNAAPPIPRVRAVSDSARDLLREALARSATVAQLVRVLQSQQVFVFLDTRVDPAIPTAETALMAATEAGRYLCVILNPALTMDRRLELLGHELQHAVEIGGDASVRDGPSLRNYYASHGRALNGSGSRHQSYETDAAHQVELQVRRDLAAATNRDGKRWLTDGSSASDASTTRSMSIPVVRFSPLSM